MAKDDFFLSFGTDANVFADKIVSESDRATESIYGLAQALSDYDRQLANTKAGGPLNSLFGALDQAAGRFGALTNQLVTGFDKALSGVTGLTEELSGLVAAVNEINIAREKVKKTGGKPPPILNVQDDEIIATDNARRAGKALGEVVELNATMARNALKRVADINNTLARSANDAAEPVSRLAKSIRDLSGASKEANGRGVVTGGGNITITGPVTMTSDGNLVNAASATPVAAKTVAPVSDQQADAVVRAEAKRRRNDPQAIEDLSTTAAPGLYTYPGVENYDAGRARKGGRLVGADVREGESFQEYFARNDATRAKIEQGRSTLPTPDRGDLLKFNEFKASGGRAGSEFEKRLRTLEQDRGSSFSTQDTVKAHTGDLGLEGQTPGLVEAIERILHVRDRQQQHAQKTITDMLQNDPRTTFGGDVFGRANSDVEIGNTFPTALHRVDEELLSTHEGDPATIKAAEARRDAAERRRLLRYNDRDAAVNPSLLKPDVGTPEQEGLTLAARRKADVAARAEARKRNAEAVAALDPIDQEAVRARRQGNPELQRINQLLGKGGLNASEIADTLGLQATTSRQPATDNAKYVQAALAREHAQTSLEAFQVDPGAYTERERQRLLAKAETFRNFDHPGSDKIAQEAQRAAATITPETLQRQLQEAIADATRTTTGLTTHSAFAGLTDASEAQAREVLENRRQAILEETSRKPAATPAPSIETEENSTRPRNQLRSGPGRRVIYRGEGADAASSAQPGSGTDLRGRFFTEDLATAQEYAGPGGRVVATSVSEKTLERARRRAVQQKVLEGLVVPEAVAKGAVDYDPEVVNPDVVGNAGRPRKERTRNKGALVKARELLAEVQARVTESNTEDQELLGALAAAEAEVEKLSAARAPKAAAGGAGGGQKPPPPNASAAGEDEPEKGGGKRRDQSVFGSGISPNKTNTSTSGQFKADYTEQIALLKQVTREILANSAARLQDTRLISDETERIAAQNRILVEAGAALKNDPHFKNFPNLQTARGTFAQAVGLPPSKDNYNRLQALFTQGGGIDASGLVNKVQQVTNAATKGKGATTQAGSLGTALFGQRGFIDSQLRHIGSAIENFAGFQLAFTGFEKLKELVDTGIQADAAFVRLQASIEATGRSTGNLRQQLQSVSSGTATGLKDTIEAASELTGVFKNNNDLVAGTKIATQLSNISEGALTAKESAVGLRDVIDAYGLTGTASVQKVGDQIARLSQITGVSVKDVMEGTTKLAQVGRQYNLTQPQAATFAAFVTRNTGETGEAAAEQVDRIFSTLDSGKVQKALTTIRTKKGAPLATPQQFAAGKQGEILTNLLAQFENLDPANQAEIRDLVSKGRQAPAFAGFIRDGKLISEQADAIKSGSDGALGRQNTAYLDTLAGQLKVLSTDFKNLGSSLQQSGVFDLIGLLAKGLDEVLKITTGILNTFNQLANSNPFTKAMKEIAVVVGEVALLFKLFGGGAGQILGRINPGRATRNKMDAAGNIVRDAEGVAQQEFAPVTFRGTGRAIWNTPGRVLRGSQGFGSSFVNSAGALFAGAGVLTGPGGQRMSDERAATLSGTQRFAAARAARAASVLEGSGPRGALTRALANSGAVGLAGVTNGVATATKGVASHISTLGKSLVGLSGSFLGPLAAMAAFGIAIDVVANSFKRSAQIGAAADALANDLRGKNDQKNKNDAAGKNADGTDKTAANDLLGKDIEAQRKANNPGVIDGLRKALTSPLVDPNSSGNFWGTYAGNNGFDKNETATNNLLNKRLRHANAETDPKKRADALKAAQAAGEKDIQGEQSYIDSLGLNHEQHANAEADLGRIRQMFESTYGRLLATAQNLNAQDLLNVQQGENLMAALTTAGGLKSETLRGGEGKATKQVILDDSTLPQGSKAYKDLQAALDGDSTRSRLVAQTSGDEEARKQALHILDTGAKSGPERERNRKLLDDANSKLQADQTSLRSLDQNNPLQLAQIAEGKGDTKGAIASQKKAISALEATNKQIGNKDDPEYIANLKKIQDEKKTLADLNYESAILAAAAAAAATNDPLIKAQKEYDKAIQEQKSVLARDHTQGEAEQAQANVDQANISKAQQAEDLRVAKFQQSIAGSVENTALINAQINENLKEQNKYSDGTLASQIKLTQLKTDEANLRQKLATTTADEANAALELQVAQLEARGQSGDLEKAAQKQVTEIQNKMQQYLAKPGAKKTDSAYQQLAAQLATAGRNSFDVALQAQMDTLDFQKETYKITSSQEVQALQEILKNKQLTLKEQRDITLKIKNLQESIRQQLTMGGFNIPSDIKLPTAYQVRRSLGGNQGNGGTTVNNVSSATNNVNINNNVPTAQVAQQIAAQVIAVINNQTGQSARANTSTPRLVGA